MENIRCSDSSSWMMIFWHIALAACTFSLPSTARILIFAAVMEEVKYLNGKYPLQRLLFMDDDFLAHRSRGLHLLTAIHRAYPHLRSRIDARVDEVKDVQFTGQLKELGLESVFFGVEGVSGEFLERIRKGCDTNDAIEAATACAKFDIAGTYPLD